MTKKKTSISIDSEIWKQWLSFVVKKNGSAREISNELEKAIIEYMERYK